jgi:hypothetical protein
VGSFIRSGLIAIACALLASVPGAHASTLVAADFNNDGYADLAIRWARVICVYLGSGDGAFAPAGCYATGPGAIGLLTADLDNDGNFDLLVLTPERGPIASGVQVLLGNGDGTFQSARFYPVGAGPRLFSIGDLNGDGVPDVAVVGTYGLCRLIGQGDGTLAPAQCLLIRELSNAHTLLTPDLNGDGGAEFVGVSQNNICIWPGPRPGRVVFQRRESCREPRPSGSSPRAATSTWRW